MGTDIERSLWKRTSLLIALLVAGLLGISTLEPIPQDLNYHRFADNRSLSGIPNFNDVASNAGFFLVGFLGVSVLLGRKSRAIFIEQADVRPYLLFFFSVALVGLGSTYYHWDPSNERLLWDRLPMSIGFMAFSSAIVADRISARAGNGWLLLVLIAAGIASLIYWHWSELQGRGDLRFYGFVQFYPMIALPFIVWLFPRHRYTSVRYLLWVIVWYALSKVLEHFDSEVFAFFGHTVSGHTLKHVAAAVSTFIVLRMLLSRTPATV